MNAKEWSNQVARLAADSLVDHGFLRKQDFERAAVIAEEILVRLSLRDYPPREESK
jgi:hypothetical protein